MQWVTTTTILQGLRVYEDDAAWERFVGRFRRPIVSFVQAAGLPATDAEDVAQETLIAFADAFRDGKYERTKGRLSQWLFGIAYRQVLRERQRRARRGAKMGPQVERLSFWAGVPDEETATDTWEREWEQALLRECLDQARIEFEPDTFRAFEIAVRDNRPAAEAARELEVSVKAIYNAKHRVLKRLRELRAQYENQE